MRAPEAVGRNEHRGVEPALDATLAPQGECETALTLDEALRLTSVEQLNARLAAHRVEKKPRKLGPMDDEDRVRRGAP